MNPIPYKSEDQQKLTHANKKKLEKSGVDEKVYESKKIKRPIKVNKK